MLGACASEPELPPLERAALSVGQLDLLSGVEAYREGGAAETASKLEATYPEVLAAQRALREKRGRDQTLALQRALLGAAGRGPELPVARTLAHVEAATRELFDDEPEPEARSILVRSLVRQERWEEARKLLVGQPPVLDEGVEGLRLRIRVRDLEAARRLAAMLLLEDTSNAEVLWLSAKVEERSEDFAAFRSRLVRAAKAGSAEARDRSREVEALYRTTSPPQLLTLAREASKQPSGSEWMLAVDALDVRLRSKDRRIPPAALKSLRHQVAAATRGDADAEQAMRDRRARVDARRKALDRRVEALLSTIDAAGEAFERHERKPVRDAIARCDRELRGLRKAYDRLRVDAALLTPPVPIGSRRLQEYRTRRDQLARARGLARGARRLAPPAAIAPDAQLGEARGSKILRARVEAAGTLHVGELNSGGNWLSVALELPSDDVPGASYLDFAGLDDARVRRQMGEHVSAARLSAFVPALFDRFAALREVRVQLRSRSGSQTARIVFDRRGAAALARAGEAPSVAALGAVSRECWYQIDDAVGPKRRSCKPDA